MVRIRYKNKKTVFEYAGVAREDAVEKAWEHYHHFRYEMTPEGRAEVPVGSLVVEYVDPKSGVVTPVPFPPPQS